MDQTFHIFQAFLAPALLVSATSLFILSINVRLMGIVSRLRQYIHAKHTATKNDRLQEAEAYTSQIQAIEKRGEMIRHCFLLALMCLIGTIAACLLVGLGLYWPQAAMAAVIVFVASLICLLVSAIYYFREVTMSLSAVREEARDSRFMDLGTQPENPGHNQL
jgi:drug/metabolite transporter (DMT)-like permease